MNDSDLRYIQRVLESNAPDEDRERAAQMVRDIRRSYGQAPAASAEPSDEHLIETGCYQTVIERHSQPAASARPVAWLYQSKGGRHE